MIFFFKNQTHKRIQKKKTVIKREKKTQAHPG
jgi:hypothetical protein